MPFCKDCGRQLGENEVCNCTAGQNFNTKFSQVTPPNGQPEAQQPQKKTNGCAIALIIGLAVGLFLFVVIGILAAILVPSMLGYTQKAKQQSANADAHSVASSVGAALAELEEEGYNIFGTFIFCSESDGNVIIERPREYSGDKSLSADIVKSTAQAYNMPSDRQWFAVCEDGVVVYSAVAEGWHTKYVGTYPASDYHDGYKFYNSSKVNTAADLQDLFDHAYREVLKNK